MLSIGLLSLLVELQVGMIVTPERNDPTITSAPGQSHVLDGVLALVNDIPRIAGAVLDAQSIVDPNTVRTRVPVRHHNHLQLFQVTAAVQLLQFSNYLSGFILNNQIDYSALQVVVKWINEVLKASPPGFERTAVLAENLGNLVHLSSGRCFYDIWKVFLTDAIPPVKYQPLEILERVSSTISSTGKALFLRSTRGIS
jgi:hypothetical protein